MTEAPKALVFSNGSYRFTVTREALERFIELSESGIDGAFGFALKEFVDGVMQTVEEEGDEIRS